MFLSVPADIEWKWRSNMDYKRMKFFKHTNDSPVSESRWLWRGAEWSWPLCIWK